MLTVRPASERGRTQLAWLDSYHTFSFNHYYDPRHMGFRQLRVLNDDYVGPGGGFPTHSHRDMEILTYVLEGALEHKDSIGTGSVIRPGEVQRMSAGRGVSHSEYNPSQDQPVHLLQIWVLPRRKGAPAEYEQRPFPAEERRGKLRLVAAPGGRDGALTIHQDVELFATLLEPGEQVAHALEPNRHAWVQVARGAVAVNGLPLKAGDGVAASQEPQLQIRAEQSSEVLLFDLA